MIFRELNRAAQMLIPWWYMRMVRPLFIFIPNPICNQDFNETILETLSMLEKALKVLLNIFGKVNAGRLVRDQPSILK